MDLRVLLMLAAEGVFAFWLLARSGLLKTPLRWGISLLLVALAFVLRGCLLSYETLDYQNFLSMWVAYFHSQGGFAALKYPVGNYNIPYLYFLALFSYSSVKDLYLIKLLSIFFDCVLADACLRLVRRTTESTLRPILAFFTALFLPTVVLNGALWGQCDGIYAALALLGIALALEKRPAAAMVCAALSFGFKLQAAFILPVYAVLWMKGDLKLKHFFLFPLTYVLLVLPAVLAGRPFLDTITLYFNQTGSIGSGLNYNSSSVFALFRNITNAELAAKLGILAAFLWMLAILLWCFLRRRQLTDAAVLAAALLFATGIPFLLPHMHDRYFFGADVLSLVLAYGFPAYFLIPLGVQFASLLGYHAYLKMRYLLLMDRGATALLVVLALEILLLGEIFYAREREEKRRPAAHRKKRS